MVPVCETTLRAPATEAVGSPSALQLQRMSLDSAASALCSAPLGALELDFDVVDCNNLLEDYEASLSGDSMHSTFEGMDLPHLSTCRHTHTLACMHSCPSDGECITLGMRE